MDDVSNMSARLSKIWSAIDGRMRLALHGTTGLGDELTRECIRRGISKINVNKIVLNEYLTNLKENASAKPLTELMDTGIDLVQASVEKQMDVCLSTGKADL
jgi:fructose-bisphosphate aldolase class II